MNSAISKATQRLTTAEDIRDDTKLIMQPKASWEAYLIQAPLSIAIMGELVFISSSTDFSINKNPPKAGYKFIKYPDSFRACLMQVCNSGWWAFNEAHTSMDQIRLHTAQVPDYMKAAVNVLFQDDDEVVKALLPGQLDNIKEIADECEKLSVATKKRFAGVINIIQELLEACVNAQYFYGEEMNSIKKKIEENKMREQSAQETKKRTEKAVKAMEEQLDQAQESYKKALDSLPGGWEMIAMDFVGGLAEGIIRLINGLTFAITHPVRNVCSARETFANTTRHLRDQERDVVAEINAYCKSTRILNCVQNMQELMNVYSENDDIAWTNLYDQRNKCANTVFIAQQFERISEELSEVSDCPVKSQAQNLCNMGIKICSQLEVYAPKGKCYNSRKIVKEVLELIKQARVFDSKSKDMTNSSAIPLKPPMMNKEVNKLENLSPGQKAAQNARFTIEQTRAQLNKTRDTYEKGVENLENNQKELTEILATMRNCELKEIDFKTTIDMLMKGMDAMGRVKVQWEKMVHFFQMVSNIVGISLKQTLKNFVSTSEQTQALSYNKKLFLKDLLYIQAFQASNTASLVHMISATYTDVSSRYLMDRVSSLGRLMAMDQSRPEFEHERQQLQNSCDAAQNHISMLVSRNKKEFDRKSAARLERIHRELLPILPAAPPEQIKSIQDDVQAGFTEDELAAYY